MTNEEGIPMTIDAAGRGHNPAGTPGGGQFNGHNRPDDLSVTLWRETPSGDEAVVKELEEQLHALPEGVVPPLQHIEPGRHLDEQQQQWYREGRIDLINDSIVEWTTEQAVVNSQKFLRDYCAERGHDYDNGFDLDQKARLRDAVYAKDPAKPVDDLIANTPKRLLA
ncbi:hypothetical protein ACWGJ9_10805 [Curtobacterium citreum]